MTQLIKYECVVGVVFSGCQSKGGSLVDCPR